MGRELLDNVEGLRPVFQTPALKTVTRFMCGVSAHEPILTL
jgi:hypothetical protein